MKLSKITLGLLKRLLSLAAVFALPNKGDTVDVRNYSNDETTTCLVVSVTRNSRTVEIVVRTPDGEAHTLVMEGR